MWFNIAKLATRGAVPLAPASLRAKRGRKRKSFSEAQKNGEDPIAARKAERAVRYFDEIASEFLSLHVKTKRKPRTHEGYVNTRSGQPRSVARFGNLELGRCEGRGRVQRESNPAKAVVRNPETAKERFLLSDEFRRLGEALARAEPKDSRSKSMNKARTPSTRQNPKIVGD
jgi:hypothetical protein